MTPKKWPSKNKDQRWASKKVGWHAMWVNAGCQELDEKMQPIPWTEWSIGAFIAMQCGFTQGVRNWMRKCSPSHGQNGQLVHSLRCNVISHKVSGIRWENAAHSMDRMVNWCIHCDAMWFHTRCQESDEKMQPIPWAKQLTGSSVGAGSLWLYLVTFYLSLC
jgi:hypothetical protein